MLTFLGIDASVVSILKCKILYQMLKNQADASSILQVWFSSAWTNKAQVEFQNAVTNLIDSNEIETGEEDLLVHWKESKIDAEAAKQIWSRTYLRDVLTYPFEACANLKNECDRVDYARYLFTGVIFADETKTKHGNVTMFCMPKNLVVRKAENENFYYTFNFNHSEFEYKGTLMKSMENLMMKKTQDLLGLVRVGKVLMDFKIATIGTDVWSLTTLFRFIQGNPRTMDWSNICDYMSKEDFIEMARHYKSKDIIHLVRIKNWTRCYKGANIFDYKEKMPVIKEALTSYNLWTRELILESENYSKMWANKLKFMNYLDILEWSLSKKCRDKYLNHFFKDVKFISDPPNVEHWGFQRLHTAINGRFTFVEEMKKTEK